MPCWGNSRDNLLIVVNIIMFTVIYGEWWIIRAPPRLQDGIVVNIIMFMVI